MGDYISSRSLITIFGHSWLCLWNRRGLWMSCCIADLTTLINLKHSELVRIIQLFIQPFRDLDFRVMMVFVLKKPRWIRIKDMLIVHVVVIEHLQPAITGNCPNCVVTLILMLVEWLAGLLLLGIHYILLMFWKHSKEWSEEKVSLYYHLGRKR